MVRTKKLFSAIALAQFLIASTAAENAACAVPPEMAPLTRSTETARSTAEQDLWRGVALSQNGAGLQSDILLQRALLVQSPAGAAVAVRYLTYNAIHRADYKQAASLGARLLANRFNGLTGNDLRGFREDVAAWSALADKPAQTTELHGMSILPIARDAGGRIEAIVHVEKREAIALFDTGAELVLVSASLARRIGLKALPTVLHDEGSTGAVNSVQLAMLDHLQIGSATVDHVVVEITDDSLMKVGPPGHQVAIDMIVGYAVLRTLGSFAIDRQGWIAINGEISRPKVICQTHEEGLALVVQTSVGGEPAELLLDTGANTTILTQDFYHRDPARFSRLIARSIKFAGIGGSRAQKSLVIAELSFRMRDGSVEMHNMKMLIEPSQLDVQGLVGNMGRDLWASYGTATFDFRHGTLVLS